MWSMETTNKGYLINKPNKWYQMIPTGHLSCIGYFWLFLPMIVNFWLSFDACFLLEFLSLMIVFYDCSCLSFDCFLWLFLIEFFIVYDDCVWELWLSLMIDFDDCVWKLCWLLITFDYYMFWLFYSGYVFYEVQNSLF